MIGLACLLLTVLFIGAVFLKKKFVNSAISLISGAPQKHQGMFESIPAWAKVLLTERLMDKFSHKESPNSREEKNVETTYIEPEYPPPPKQDDVIIDVEYPKDHKRLITSSSESDSGALTSETPPDNHGPMLLPPGEAMDDYNGNHGNIEINHNANSSHGQEHGTWEHGSEELLTKNIDAKEIDQPLGLEKQASNTQKGLDQQHPEIPKTEIPNLNHEAGEKMGSNTENSSSFDTPERPSIQQDDQIGHEQNTQFDSLLQQFNDPEKEKEREFARQRYNQLLSEGTWPEQSEQEDPKNEENSLRERYHEIERGLHNS